MAGGEGPDNSRSHATVCTRTISVKRVSVLSGHRTAFGPQAEHWARPLIAALVPMITITGVK